jgi:hypothetical protein
MARLPIYKVVLSDDDEGMDFNAFVDYPAHSKAFHLFDGQKPLKQLFSDDEKRIVTGVAIATNLPIFRRDEGTVLNITYTSMPTPLRRWRSECLRKDICTV